MLAGIREKLNITIPEDQAACQRLLGDGSRFGVEVTYAVQPKPKTEYGQYLNRLVGESENEYH